MASLRVFGHVLVVTGYDEGGYYVNDPAGTWSQIFKGGYRNAWNESTEGRNIYYRKDAFERAIATYDGYTFPTSTFMFSANLKSIDKVQFDRISDITASIRSLKTNSDRCYPCQLYDKLKL